MKQLPKACQLSLLAITMAGCSYVPNIEGRLQSLQLETDTYVARAGETLESIAFRYNLPPEKLASLNPSLSARVPAGTHIHIRPGALNNTDNENAGTWIQPSRTRTANTANSGDIVIASPVYRPQAVASVNAVARDITRPNGSLAAQQVRPLVSPTVREEFIDDDILDIGGYPREEIIEDDYEEVQRAASRKNIDKQLRKYIGNWAWPTDGQLARSYAPETPGGYGVDIAGLPGQHVVAAMDGTVAYSGRDPSGFGKLIIVKHADSLMTTYSHTQDLFVAEDDVVRAGDPIASLGSNANQESVLRFEVRRDGNPLNPMDFFPIN